MKRTPLFVALFLVVSAHPITSHAQFFKNLVNNATQHMANKAAANQTSGKPDSTGKSKSTYDSAYLAGLMANAYKPKGGVSPADSAAAIKNFMTGSGGEGIFYQYLDIYTFKTAKQKDSTLRDTMSIAIADNHNTRSDLGMLGMRMQVVGHASLPGYSMILYPENKTYKLNIIDTAAINAGGQQSFQVTKVGAETVGGYHCIHSKLTVNSGKKSVVTEDIWTSTEVSGYETLKKMSTMQHVTPKMLTALDQAGCGGFFIKMEMQSAAFSMSMLLIHADRKSLPASMFEIPTGYTQATNSSIFAQMAQKH